MSASLPVELMKKYKDKNGSTIFFETGTSGGDTVQTAIEAGFESIYSIEYDPAIYHAAFQRFHGNERVKILLGSSPGVMAKILPGLKGKILFWLDAHPECGVGCTPILSELEKIRLHHPADNVILADDMRLMGLQRWTVRIHDIMKEISKFPVPYRITFEHNEHSPFDVFAAYPEIKK